MAEHRRDILAEELLHQLYQNMESLDRHNPVILEDFFNRLIAQRPIAPTVNSMQPSTDDHYETIKPTKRRPASAESVQNLAAELQNLSA